VPLAFLAGGGWFLRRAAQAGRWPRVTGVVVREIVRANGRYPEVEYVAHDGVARVFVDAVGRERPRWGRTSAEEDLAGSTVTVAYDPNDAARAVVVRPELRRFGLVLLGLGLVTLVLLLGALVTETPLRDHWH
jgi:hypothetical protein